jgi:glycosyltransferase involved in cell wall biosynthesis
VAEHYGSDVIVLDDETPQGLARCIERSVALPAEERASLGARARAAVEGVTWRTEAEKVLAFIQSLTTQSSAKR